jgi:hypothetical protein
VILEGGYVQKAKPASLSSFYDPSKPYKSFGFIDLLGHKKPSQK